MNDSTIRECITPIPYYFTRDLSNAKLALDATRAQMLALEHARDELADATIGLAMFGISQQLANISETLGELLCGEVRV